MPDMDGFKLLEIIGLEMDLPVLSKHKMYYYDYYYYYFCSCKLHTTTF